jgi:hypothetical protein
LGFAKNDRENIDDKELEELRKLEHYYLEISQEEIIKLIKECRLIEVIYARET